MARNQYLKIRRRIQEQVATKNGRAGCLSRNVHWIIQMYLYYAWRALVNGWTIKIRASWNVTPVIITLERESVRELKEKEKGKFFMSNMLFGDMFSLKMSGDQIDQGYDWYPDVGLAELLQKSLDSDNIYELIKS